MMGLAVRPVSGKRLTLEQAMDRNAAKILSTIPLYIGFFAAFITCGNRAWHDMLSGTAVTDRK
jgi:uncharacterized RDD family membrane protein YckC